MPEAPEAVGQSVQQRQRIAGSWSGVMRHTGMPDGPCEVPTSTATACVPSQNTKSSSVIPASRATTPEATDAARTTASPPRIIHHSVAGCAPTRPDARAGAPPCSRCSNRRSAPVAAHSRRTVRAGLLHRGNACRMIARCGRHCLRRQRLGVQPQLVAAQRRPRQPRIIRLQRPRQAIEPEWNALGHRYGPPNRGSG